ncbi:hypothetical protein E1B28_007243 [Marasmius oreades]|uniref:Uncharacterized protein n=1 Tax=Marasmius oreades TaxID=181124 RepID=A0A9P7UTK5_9AGAR|nr:uncharacterized protein E1B28_007243 [Marasmius oreades]KAG7093573.1 hypothetical protein E1B28_007243 [Marasmius oreades]
MHVPSQKCSHSENTPTLLRPLFTIIFETSSALLITFRTAKSFRAYGANRNNILFFIFEEGLTYFCLISLFTVATFILKLRATSGPYQDILNAFTLPLSGILTARFILHLRGWREQEIAYVKSVTNLHQPTPSVRQGQNYPPLYNFGAAMSLADDTSRPPMSPLSDTSTLIPEFGEDPEVTAKRQAHALQRGYPDRYTMGGFDRANDV